MGVFTRFRDIISANLNSMLDSAEDPEKMIKMMIREMEDTLVEIKATCAGVMADSKKTKRLLGEVRSRVSDWAAKAELAVSKLRDDLAREALLEKRRYADRAESLEEELGGFDTLIEKYKEDIRQLEDKLQTAREKQRILIQRHVHARKKKRAQEEIRRMDSSEAMVKFDRLENRIERMEADADLVNYGKKKSLDEKFDEILFDDEIEKELQALKSKPAGSDESTPGT